MKLVIVSGRSGSGKSILLHMLEDLGYYCVDNLPVDMLPTLIGKLQPIHPRLAISIDARNVPTNAYLLQEVIAKLREPLSCEIIYLDADEKSLLKRFSETRRKHPLTNASTTLREAIAQEKQRLSALATMADITVDTSLLTPHQLCALMRDRMASDNNHRLQLLFQSFGFKNGMPADADFVFDVRCLPNPFWDPILRPLTGKDRDVIQFLEAHPEVSRMIDNISQFLTTWVPQFEANNRSYLTISIGCTGGQHRSVYIAEKLFERALLFPLSVHLRHRDLPERS